VLAVVVLAQVVAVQPALQAQIVLGAVVAQVADIAAPECFDFAVGLDFVRYLRR